jgi:hypothetical protein
MPANKSAAAKILRMAMPESIDDFGLPQHSSLKNLKI